MQCVKPFSTSDGDFGCGQCMPCRINRRRQKTGRLICEALCHEHSTFVTLTYKEAPGELSPPDAQKFIKALRDLVRPRQIRYYLVGEYGEKEGRPHYHAIIFGMDKREHATIAQAWGKGFVYCGDVTRESCSYVAGYVLKKLTDIDNPHKDKHPEFARMSLKPGIGAKAADMLAEGLMSRGGASALSKLGDVPHEIMHAGKRLPLDRYMRGQLRAAVGWDKSTPKDRRDKIIADKANETADAAALRHKRGKAAQFRAAAANLHARSKKVL